MLQMIFISPDIKLADYEVEFTAMRAQGSGGQNVNKVSSAVHLRFDIRKSSLPDAIKARLLNSHDHRISNEGVIIIKSQQTRSQFKNRQLAIERLRSIILAATKTKKFRVKTRPSKASVKKRREKKQQTSSKKNLRKKVNPDD